MSFSLNKVIIAGNLTRDPEVKFLANERAVANFGLAINERYKDKDGNKKETVTFIDVEAWGRTAELVGQYLTKGRACYIEGKLKLDVWEESDGKKRTKLKVVADSVQFLGNKPNDEASDPLPSESARPKQQRPASSAGGHDEPPF
jgi:single-strand DNA-binding protein